MRLPIYTAAFTGLMASPALAADLELNLEIPRLTVAEYHRPYVAVWIETPDKAAVKTLAVWYDVKLKNQEGQKWLKDMRQWWRRAGRDMTLPADGVSGATRAPGVQTLAFTPDADPLPALEPGPYTLIVEAAREAGGRESVALPFTWPAKGGAALHATGETEIGAVDLRIEP